MLKRLTLFGALFAAVLTLSFGAGAGAAGARAATPGLPSAAAYAVPPSWGDSGPPRLGDERCGGGDWYWVPSHRNRWGAWVPGHCAVPW